MTTRRAGDFDLAADMSGFGDFAAIGLMREPSIGLAAAITNIRNGLADTDLQTDLTYALARRVAGRCVFESSEAELTVHRSFLARVVMEWRITIPEAGSLQALFVVGRFQAVEGSARLFDLVLQLAGKPALHPLEPGALEAL